MYLDRLSGKSVRAIAEEFGCNSAEAQAIIAAQCTAAALMLRIQERRAAYLGTETPLRVDTVQVRAEAAPQPSGTDRILEALNRLAGKPETGELH